MRYRRKLIYISYYTTNVTTPNEMSRKADCYKINARSGTLPRNSDYSNIAIRTQTVKHHLQNLRSHIYASQEEALAVVHRVKQEGKGQ